MNKPDDFPSSYIQGNKSGKCCNCKPVTFFGVVVGGLDSKMCAYVEEQIRVDVFWLFSSLIQLHELSLSF
jgi:hypothetical protein